MVYHFCLPAISLSVRKISKLNFPLVLKIAQALEALQLLAICFTKSNLPFNSDVLLHSNGEGRHNPLALICSLVFRSTFFLLYESLVESKLREISPALCTKQQLLEEKPSLSLTPPPAGPPMYHFIPVLFLASSELRFL